MAETIGQHNIAAITAPVNGQPQDANVVRGNDNTIRVEHNAHDNDAGIHLQSSVFGSLPAAGTAGRKWVTDDDGTYELWYDDGARWHHVSSGFLLVDAIADASLDAGQVVKITGFNVGQELPRVDVTSSASDIAFGVVLRDVSSGGIASIINTGLVSPVNTHGYAPGTVLYHGGSGTFTATQPASGTYQACAIVLRENTNNGVMYVEFSEPTTVEATAATANTLAKRDGSGNLTATSFLGTLAASYVQPGTFPNGTFSLQNLTVTGTLTATVSSVAASAVQPGTFASGAFAFPQSLTVDTNTFHVDHTNDRVGVKTTSPQAPLHVAGNARVDGLLDLSNVSSGRVRFSSSAGGEADPNTLDAFEEATLTLTPAGDIVDTVFTGIKNNAYVKIGRLVCVSAEFAVESTDAIPATWTTNLPTNTTGIQVAVFVNGVPHFAATNSTGSFTLYTQAGSSVSFASLNNKSVWFSYTYLATF